MSMKGLLKGLKYFTQIFEEEEEDNEMQIGLPTDVKHVAHIGWDGPSVNSPSWMNEFKSPAPGSSSTPPLQANGETNNREIEEPKVKKSSVRESPGRDTAGLPKSSRRQESWDSIEADSPNMSPRHNKSKSSRRRHKHKENDRGESSSSSNNSLPNIPKKSRRKKSKDIDGSNKSSKSKDKGGSIHGSEDGSTKHYSEPNSSSSLASLKEHQVIVDDSW